MIKENRVWYQQVLIQAIAKGTDYDLFSFHCAKVLNFINGLKCSHHCMTRYESPVTMTSKKYRPSMSPLYIRARKVIPRALSSCSRTLCGFTSFQQTQFSRSLICLVNTILKDVGCFTTYYKPFGKQVCQTQQIFYEDISSEQLNQQQPLSCVHQQQFCTTNFFVNHVRFYFFFQIVNALPSCEFIFVLQHCKRKMCSSVISLEFTAIV